MNLSPLARIAVNAVVEGVDAIIRNLEEQIRAGHTEEALKTLIKLRGLLDSVKEYLK